MDTHKIPVASIIGRLNKFLSDEFEKRLQLNGLDVSIIEFVLLYRLSTIQEDEITQQNFANMEGKHKSVILRQLGTMEEKKWIAKMDDSKDMRKNMITLTRGGINMLNKALAIEAEMTKELTEGLPADEIEIFKKVALTIQKRLAGPATNKN